MPKKKIHKKKRNKFGIILFILILLLVGLLMYKNSQGNSSRIASDDAKNSLQIGFYNPFSPKETEPTQPTTPPTQNAPTKKPDAVKAPPPEENASQYCAHDTGTRLPFTDTNCKCKSGWYVTCVENKCVNIDQEKSGSTRVRDCEDWNEKGWCAPPFTTDGADGDYCIGKPIIYLYPETPTHVDVKIETIGNIFISDPLYPDEGWKDVLAYPSGSLFYQGEQYQELFYETDVKDFQKPTNGISISKGEIEPKLEEILTKLGLNEWEKGEFMEYWVPILENQEKPHIMFSLITGAAKEKIDKVIINPKPDTFIEVLAYFKPLDKPFQGPALLLPENPPIRTGFTAVEWGGVVDDKKD